jgi:hypothetical protein
VKGSEGYDPVFERGDGRFIILNLCLGACIGWFAAAWMLGIALVMAWSLLSSTLAVHAA